MQSSTEAAPPRRIIRVSRTFIIAVAVIALVIASLPVAFELGKRSKEPVTEIPLTMNVSERGAWIWSADALVPPRPGQARRT